MTMEELVKTVSDKGGKKAKTKRVPPNNSGKKYNTQAKKLAGRMDRLEMMIQSLVESVATSQKLTETTAQTALNAVAAQTPAQTVKAPTASLGNIVLDMADASKWRISRKGEGTPYYNLYKTEVQDDQGNKYFVMDCKIFPSREE